MIFSLIDNSSSTHVDKRKGILVKKIFKSTITMKVTAFCMLILQKHINSKQKTSK